MTAHHSHLGFRAMVVCLLAVGASAVPASAAPNAHNLLWDDCGLGAYSTNHMDACDSDGPPPHRLFVSVVPGERLEGIIGAEGVIEAAFDGTTIPDWWQLYSGGCRQGRITGDLQVGLSAPPFTCSPAWTIESAAVFGVNAEQPGYPSNRLRIRWAVGAVEAVTLDPAVAAEFYVLGLTINRLGTTTCAGCDVAASLSLIDGVKLVRPAGDPRFDVFITQPAITPFIYWQAGPTPARNRTWGEVKQLYR